MDYLRELTGTTFTTIPKAIRENLNCPKDDLVQLGIRLQRIKNAALLSLEIKDLEISKVILKHSKAMALGRPDLAYAFKLQCAQAETINFAISRFLAVLEADEAYLMMRLKRDFNIDEVAEVIETLIEDPMDVHYLLSTSFEQDELDVEWKEEMEVQRLINDFKIMSEGTPTDKSHGSLSPYTPVQPHPRPRIAKDDYAITFRQQ